MDLSQIWPKSAIAPRQGHLTFSKTLNHFPPSSCNAKWRQQNTNALLRMHGQTTTVYRMSPPEPSWQPLCLGQSCSHAQPIEWPSTGRLVLLIGVSKEKSKLPPMLQWGRACRGDESRNLVLLFYDLQKLIQTSMLNNTNKNPDIEAQNTVVRIKSFEP